MTSREILNSQLEHLQMKYVGTGHSDTTKHEWLTNQHRDSYASYVGHQPTLAYFALAQNESIGRLRANYLESMILPCGTKPQNPGELS